MDHLPAIDAKNLSKHFGTFTAINGVSFSVQSGECFGLLGPNGAGKSSIAKMVYAFSPVSSGGLMVLGEDVRRSQRRIKAQSTSIGMDDVLSLLWRSLASKVFYSFVDSLSADSYGNALFYPLSCLDRYRTKLRFFRLFLYPFYFPSVSLCWDFLSYR